MVALRIDWPQPQPTDANSEIRSGAKFYVYANETTTPLTLYSDRDGLNTRANPVVADSAGAFPVVYVADSVSLMTLVLTDSAGVQIGSDWDNYEPEVSNDLTELANYVARAGGNSNRMTGPFEEKEATALTAATSLDLDAMTGSWGHVTGNTAISTLTLANGSRRTLIFDGTPTLAHSANLLLGGANITAHAGLILIFAGEGSGVTRLVGGITASGRAIVESVSVTLPLGDQTTAISAGTNKRRWRSPFAWTVTEIRGALASAQASGNVVTFDVNNAGNSMLSTKVTISNNAVSSKTAPAVQPVIDTTYDDIADDSLIAIDIDQCDVSTAAAGADVTLIGYRINVA